MLLVGLTGMPGAGKSTVASMANSQMCFVYDVRPLLRDIVSSSEDLNHTLIGRQLAPDSKLRHKFAEALAREIKALDAAVGNVLIDCVHTRITSHTLRTIENSRLLIVGVLAPREDRRTRYYIRARSDDVGTSFDTRDEQAIALGTASTLAMADKYIVNDSSLEVLRVRSRCLFSSLGATL